MKNLIGFGKKDLINYCFELLVNYFVKDNYLLFGTTALKERNYLRISKYECFFKKRLFTLQYVQSKQKQLVTA